MLLHSYLPSFARVPVALAEIAIGTVLLSAWIAFALLGLAGAALHDAVYRRWIQLPPPNTTITSRVLLRMRFGRHNRARVRHSYEPLSGHV
jgi:hypothetical protein